MRGSTVYALTAHVLEELATVVPSTPTPDTRLEADEDVVFRYQARARTRRHHAREAPPAMRAKVPPAI